jgi:hypothetical protein
MSVAHVTWAFAQNVGTGTRKLVLVALADRCNKDTLCCRPYIKTVAQDCNLSERAVRMAIDYLCDEARLIQRRRRRSEDGTLRGYDYVFPPVAVHAEPAAPDAGSPAARGAAHEPEVDLEPKPLAAAPQNGKSQRPRNDVWDTLNTLFGEPTTRSAQTLRGKVCFSLRQAGATPDEIIRRAKRWPLHFDSATLTAPALEKHWDTLARKPLRRA